MRHKCLFPHSPASPSQFKLCGIMTQHFSTDSTRLGASARKARSRGIELVPVLKLFCLPCS